MDSIKIRPLKIADAKRVIDLILKAAKKSGSRITEVLSGEKSSDTPKGDIEAARIALGFSVLQELYESVTDDLLAWFADLCGVSVDQYMELPINTTLDVMEYLIEGEENERFFTRVFQLVNKMKAFGEKLKGNSAK